MYTKPALLAFLISTGIIMSCNDESATTNAEKQDTGNNEIRTVAVKEEAVDYKAGNITCKSYVSYDENNKSPQPIVLVVPEWWGLTEYPRTRAKMLAEMGYFAMAVDMYGDGKLADNPKDAMAAATPFYQDPVMAKARLDAALAKAKTFAQADTSKVIAIGYCFGGSMVLNYGKLGAPLTGVVSFHGGLEGVPPQKGTSTPFLICNGAADSFVPDAQVAAFRKSMDSAGISYEFKSYANAKHAFTNPAATENGKKHGIDVAYNGAADTASWNDMKAFFSKILH